MSIERRSIRRLVQCTKKDAVRTLITMRFADLRATAAGTAKLRCYLAGAPAGGASPGAAGLLPVVAVPSRDLPEGSPK